MSKVSRFHHYELAHKHDESIIDRNKQIEATHPAWKQYRKELSEAWQTYQQTMDDAMRKRDEALKKEPS